MYRIIGVLGLVFLAVVIGCMNKYAVLKGTGIPNPPTEKVRIYVGEIEESRKNLNPQKQEDKKSYKEEIETRLKQPELHILQIAAGPEDLEGEKTVPNPFELVEEKKDAQLEIRGSFALLGTRASQGEGADSTVTSYEILITVKDMLTYDDVYSTGRSGESHFIHDTPEQRRAFGDLFVGMMVEKALF